MRTPTIAPAFAALAALASRAAAAAPPDRDDGALRLHEATFLASHNAHAALAVAAGNPLGELAANQDGALLDQLRDDGVRGLLLDLLLDDERERGAGEALRLVHGRPPLSWDYGGFRDALASALVPFLEGDGDAVVFLFLEVVGGAPAAILQELEDAFSSATLEGVALREMTFKYDHPLWADHEDWPTLDEVRRAGQRVLVFAQWSELASAEFGFMYDRQVLQENDWRGIDDCTERYMWGEGRVSLPSNDRWTRLFFMNHFCCGSGPGAKEQVVGPDLIGGGNNGWGIMYPRILQCMSNNGGFKPNFLVLDWVSQGAEAREIVDYLNFGGRLGTGQACDEDSHCATSSCDTASGVCQCQACPPDGPDGAGVCPGCVAGQYCASGGGEPNACVTAGESPPSPPEPGETQEQPQPEPDEESVQTQPESGEVSVQSQPEEEEGEPQSTNGATVMTERERLATSLLSVAATSLLCGW